MDDDAFNSFDQDNDGIDPIDMIGSDADPLLFDEDADTATLAQEDQSPFELISPYEEYDPSVYEDLGADTDAYQFDTVKSNATQQNPRSTAKLHDGPNPFVVAIIVFSLLGGAAFVVWNLFSQHLGGGDGSHTTSSSASSGQGEDEQSSSTRSLQGKDIMALIAEDFSYDGQDLSLSSNRLGVQIRNGMVVVTHSLESGAKMVPASLVRNAGLRANTLAAKLTDSLVGGGEGSLFQRLTWIVRDANGKIYLATIEDPGEVRSSDDSYGVLATSKGYVMAPGILLALGENPGIALRGGEKPTDLDGFDIVADSKYGLPTTSHETTTPVVTQPPEQKDEKSDKKDEKKKKDSKKDTKKDEKKSDSSDSNKSSSDKKESKDSSGGNSGGNSGGSSGGNSGGSSGGNSGGTGGGDSGGSSGGSSGGDTGGSDTGGDTGGGDSGDSGGGGTDPAPDPDPGSGGDTTPTPDPDPSGGEEGGE